jgi:hypothetical protein
MTYASPSILAHGVFSFFLLMRMYYPAQLTLNLPTIINYVLLSALSFTTVKNIAHGGA